MNIQKLIKQYEEETDNFKRKILLLKLARPNRIDSINVLELEVTDNDVTVSRLKTLQTEMREWVNGQIVFAGDYGDYNDDEKVYKDKLIEAFGLEEDE